MRIRIMIEIGERKKSEWAKLSSSFFFSLLSLLHVTNSPVTLPSLSKIAHQSRGHSLVSMSQSPQLAQQQQPADIAEVRHSRYSLCDEVYIFNTVIFLPNV